MTRIIASGLVVAGAAAILVWLLEGEPLWLEVVLAGMCTIVSVFVLVSIWKK